MVINFLMLKNNKIYIYKRDKQLIKKINEKN